MAGNVKHGHSYDRIYKCWADMKTRCLNKKHKWYGHYGGRGITVCDEWMRFEPFAEWALSHGYAEDLTIDRIDNDKGYCPENCKWSTQQEQSMNKRHLPNKTGYVGVHKRISRGKNVYYSAEACRNRKFIYIGNFKTPEEASAARTRYLKEVLHEDVTDRGQ